MFREFFKRCVELFKAVFNLDPEVISWKKACVRHPELDNYGLTLDYNLWAEYNRECLLRMFMEVRMEMDGLPTVKENYPTEYRLESEELLRRAIVCGYIHPITYELLDRVQDLRQMF